MEPVKQFLRRNLLVILFSTLILLQFMTWMDIRTIRDRRAPSYSDCGSYNDPCSISGRVEAEIKNVRELAKEIASEIRSGR